jgi:hypothetical protein
VGQRHGSRRRTIRPSRLSPDALRRRPATSELSLPENFEEKQLEEWTQRIGTPRQRTLLSRGLEEALRQASREVPL